VRPDWTAGVGGDSGVIPVESTSEFYRIWSALQFVYCLPTGNNELSIQELFGDGLQVHTQTHTHTHIHIHVDGLNLFVYLMYY
jgi:hypothetical protein